MNKGRYRGLLLCSGLGFFAQVSQILLMREFFVTFKGNEISFGLVFAAWLFWVAMGGGLGACGRANTRGAYRGLVFFNLYLATLLPIEIILIRRARMFFALLPGTEPSPLALGVFAFVVLAFFCVPFGIQFTLAANVYARWHGRDSQAIYVVYLLESIGGLLAGALCTYVLVVWLDTFQIVFAVCALLILLSLVAIKSLGAPKLLLMHLMVAWLALFLGFGLISQVIDYATYQQYWALKLPGYTLRQVAHSRYGNIAVLQRAQSSQYNFFVNGELCGTTPDNDHAADTASLVMTQHTNPRKVLVIGAGVTGLLREIRKHPISCLHYVQLDPCLIQITRPYLSPADQRALQATPIFYQDARHYLKTTRQQYDLIVMNLPNPFSLRLNRFYTLEFFRNVKKRLRPGGTFITAIESTPQPAGLQLEVDSSLYLTLRHVFAKVLLTPGRWRYYFASESQKMVSLDIPTLITRYRQRGVHTPCFRPEEFYLLVGSPSAVDQIRSLIEDHLLGAPAKTPDFLLSPAQQKLRRAQRAARLAQICQKGHYLLNTDNHPITYLLNLMIANRKTITAYRSLFDHLRQVRGSWIVILCLVPLLLAITLLPLGQQRLLARYSLGGVILSTGFFGMMAQMLLLLALQNIHGYVYEQMGIMIAAFMLGLALGAWCVQRLLMPHCRLLPLLLGWQVSLVIFPVLLAAFLQWQQATNFLPLFLLLNLSVGFLDGGAFPLASRLYLASDGSFNGTAGTLYACDLVGACLGALCGGTILVPLFGLVPSCLIIALVCLTALLMLGIYTMSLRKGPG